MKKIPLSRPFVNDEIRQAAVRVIDSGSFILSKECEAFEAELANHIGTKHAVLCSNWTSGVFILHQAMGLKADDEVIRRCDRAFRLTAVARNLKICAGWSNNAGAG